MYRIRFAQNAKKWHKWFMVISLCLRSGIRVSLKHGQVIVHCDKAGALSLVFNVCRGKPGFEGVVNLNAVS